MSRSTPRPGPEEIDRVLGHALTGRLELPTDPGYEARQPWNTTVAQAPAAKVMAVEPGDVVATVRFAAEHGFRVAVQATGHGAVGLGEDVLLVDTGQLQTCVVDTEQATARIGAGVLARTLLAACAPHDLAPIVGSAASVGLVGYLTGGGVGPFCSTFGLSADYVRSLEVVTGDGRALHVSPQENAELYWALRGGKTAGAIVTELELGLERLGKFYGGALYFDGAHAEQVLRAWGTWSATLPSHATTSAALVRLPPLPTVPPPLAGRLAVAIRYAGVTDSATCERDLTPMRDAAPVILDDVNTKPYAEMGRIYNEPVDPMPLLQDQLLLDALPQEAVDALVRAAGPESDSALLVVEVRRLGGRLADEPEHPSAFTARHAPYSLTAIGVAPPPARDAVQAQLAQTLAALGPWGSGAALINFVHKTGADRVAACYDDAALARLREIAATYDPDALLALAGQVPR